MLKVKNVIDFDNKVFAEQVKEYINYIPNMIEFQKILDNIQTYDSFYGGIVDKFDNKMYAYTIVINNQKYKYYEGLGHKPNKCKEELLINVIWNILLEANSFLNNSYNSFINEFGYKDNDNTDKIYKECKNTCEKILYSGLATIYQIENIFDIINL